MIKNIFGDNIPLLGFGTMRLPENDGEIDIETYKKMADLYVSRGFTYFDTAYYYHDGKSETAMKAAVTSRFPRDKIYIADKMPIYAVNKDEDLQMFFDNQLERTGAGYFDYYLLHALNHDTYTEKTLKFNIWDFCLELKKKGLIKHFGFSFHDTPEWLDKILTEHPETEFVQLQINYDDWDNPDVRSRECWEIARKHGKPVIIMEPVKGGTLASVTPEIQKMFGEFDPRASAASWAVRFAASLPGVLTVLSGMSNLLQIDDNTAFMSTFKPLSEEERAVIFKAADIIHQTPTIPCTRCKYCLDGCPQKIYIPRIISALNQYRLYGSENYAYAVREGGKASECIACGACESSCPQHIKIREVLREAAKCFENK